MIKFALIPILVAALLWTSPTQHKPAAQEPAAALAEAVQAQKEDIIPVAETAVTVAAETQKTELTAAEAEQIALAHAGFDRSDVTRLRTETDYERTGKEYEVSFRVGRWEYEYDISAATGKILEWEKDD